VYTDWSSLPVRLLGTLGLTLAFSLACAGPIEGDEAGECSDGADNDRNGYFDCDDHGCTGSPDCAADADADTDADTDADSDADSDSDTDADSDSDTDTDTDTDTSVSGFTRYEVEMDVGWTFPQGGFDDCDLVYVGSGDLYDTDGGRVSFSGPYTLAETTCTNHASIASMFPWYDEDTGEAVVSFVFTDGGATVDEWFADETEYQQGVRAEWWMYDMAAVYYPDALYAEHSESYSDPDGYFIVTYEVAMTFYDR
jgi:hypothetical protein